MTMDWQTHLDRRLTDAREEAERRWAEHQRQHTAEAHEVALAKVEQDRRLTEANHLRELLEQWKAQSISKDDYEHRHETLVGQATALGERLNEQQRTTPSRTEFDAAIKATGEALGRLSDRITTLEKGNAALLARYAVIGTLGVIIFAALFGLLLHVLTD